MIVLILNCGSSSLKFQVVDTDLDRIAKDEDRLVAKGVCERLGSQSLVTLAATGKPVEKRAVPLRDHEAAITYLVRWLDGTKIDAVGHRVVQVRERILRGLEALGLRLDAAANANAVGSEARISQEGSGTALYVIPTNEELLIARDTVRAVIPSLTRRSNAARPGL